MHLYVVDSSKFFCFFYFFFLTDDIRSVQRTTGKSTAPTEDSGGSSIVSLQKWRQRRGRRRRRPTTNCVEYWEQLSFWRFASKLQNKRCRVGFLARSRFFTLCADQIKIFTTVFNVLSIFHVQISNIRKTFFNF